MSVSQVTVSHIVFIILSAIALIGALGVVTTRNLFRAALFLVLSFIGVAGFYILLEAEFLAMVQILVYVGAVAIVIVFAILLTHAGEVRGAVLSRTWLAGLVIAGLVAGALIAAIGSSAVGPDREVGIPEVTVREIGQELMGQYVVPLEIMALLLTAALIGGVVIAMRDRPEK